MRILLTGAAGFIGSHLAEKLLMLGNEVTGIDNFDRFYSRDIKERNIENALQNPGFHFIEGDICDTSLWENIRSRNFDVIVHLAAKAGVRPSMEDPLGYN